MPQAASAAPSRVILHVDMDAFYASVEERDQPELRGRPVMVGGRPESRGVVAAANYAARRFGVHSAMPSSRARRLCPDGVFLPPRFARYGEVSRQIRAVFDRYTPLVEPLALDEAFLDVTGSLRLFGSGEAMGRAIKAAIADELGLVASVGVAPNKFLAKIASDLRKPDGFVVVTPDAVPAFLHALPVSRLWGAGPAAMKVFARLGIRTLGQLRAYPAAVLREHFGQAGEHFWRLARGEDARPVVAEHEARSVSNETTFAEDLREPALLRACLLGLTEQVAERLRNAGLAGRTVQIKLRFADFRTLTRAHTLPSASQATDVLWSVARRLLEDNLPPGHDPVRLLGMGVSGFTDEGSRQPGLFDDELRQGARLDQVTDQARARFGRGALRRAGSLKRRD